MARRLGLKFYRTCVKEDLNVTEGEPNCSGSRTPADWLERQQAVSRNMSVWARSPRETTSGASLSWYTCLTHTLKQS